MGDSLFCLAKGEEKGAKKKVRNKAPTDERTDADVEANKLFSDSPKQLGGTKQTCKK